MKRTIPLGFSLAAILLPLACGESPDDSGEHDGLGGEVEVIVQSSGGKNAGSGGAGASGGSTGGGTGGTPVPELEGCTIYGTPSVGVVGEGLVDDFEDGDLNTAGTGMMGIWFPYEDMSGGNLEYEVVDGGVGGKALRLSGAGFKTWGSGNGVSLAADPAQGFASCLFDATVFDGLTFFMKGTIDSSGSNVVEGDRDVVKVILVSKGVIPIAEGGSCDPLFGQCWDSHKTRVAPAECWTRVSIPFAEFAQDGWGLDAGELRVSDLSSINFELAQGQTYEIFLDELAFYSGPAPEEEVHCGMGGAGGAGGADG